MYGFGGGESDGEGNEVERSKGRERRLRGFSARRRRLDDECEPGMKLILERLRYGVRPVDIASLGSGPGSENRTFFFGFVGVLDSAGGE